MTHETHAHSQASPPFPVEMGGEDLKGLFAALGADPMIGVALLGEDGHIFCSEKCLNIWIEDHKEEEDDDV